MSGEGLGGCFPFYVGTFLSGSFDVPKPELGNGEE
jgi:hypothetical protein